MTGVRPAVLVMVLTGGVLGLMVALRPTATPGGALGGGQVRVSSASHAPRSDSAAEPLGVRVERLSASGAREQLVTLLASEAERDPALAVRLAAGLSESEGQLEALHECLPLWLQGDPGAARDWLLANVAQLPVEVAQELARAAGAHEPALGLAVAQQMHVGARPRAIKDVFVEWAGKDPPAAAREAALLSRADGQVPVLGEVARIWAENDPRSAFRWAQQLPDSEQQRETLTPIVARWAVRDVQEAAGQAANLPDAPWRQRVLDQVAGQWAERDPERALSWARSLSSPAAREAASGTVLAGMLAAQPSRAAELALSLGGPNSVLVEKLVTSWVASDPAAALAWAEGNPGRGPVLALALARFREQDAAGAALWAQAHRTHGAE